MRPEVEIVFSAVATPPGEDYQADLRAVFAVCETVATHIDHDLVFVNKSTVPVGTGEQCQEKIDAILQKRGVDFSVNVISNPEFLREGMAVNDTLMPDRIVVGINDNAVAEQKMHELYRPITRVGKPLVVISRESAEVVKYASNAFLATKISFINMLSELTEVVGANIRDVARGMGLDDRIGPRFLHAGIGYGGSCFPKDVKALLATAKQYGVALPIVDATDSINQYQRKRFFNTILTNLSEISTIAIWGLSFKPKTDDMREAPSIDLLPLLIDAGHSVVAYDPEATENAKPLMPSEVQYVDSPLEAAQNADAVILLTEWDCFRGVDLDALKEVMNGIQLFDGRNVYDPREVEEVGLTYIGIGL